MPTDPLRPLKKATEPLIMDELHLLRFTEWWARRLAAIDQAIDAARKAVKIHRVEWTINQLRYWQNVRAAAKWLSFGQLDTFTPRSKSVKRPKAER